jgi:hypothetical protein
MWFLADATLSNPNVITVSIKIVRRGGEEGRKGGEGRAEQGRRRGRRAQEERNGRERGGYAEPIPTKLP